MNQTEENSAVMEEVVQGLRASSSLWCCLGVDMKGKLNKFQEHLLRKRKFKLAK
jgi:hypothetical protein